jgi:aspartate/methionine/tyrosine aminotransferase
MDDLLDPAAFPEAEPSDVVNLHRASPVYDAAFERSGPSNVHTTRSTAGDPELRRVVAETFRSRHSRILNPADQVLITRGATAAYAHALDAFVNPGDPVVLFDPTSPLFSAGAKSRRAKIRWVNTWNEDGRCRFLLEGLAKAMRGAMMLVLSNPSNPTGGILGFEEWEQIAWLAQRQDESFARYEYAEAARLPSREGFQKRLLSAGSVSQAFGMADSRVGWLTGPKELVDACRLASVLSAPFVPSTCQAAALRALRTPPELFQPTLEQFRKRRQYAVDRLRGMNLDVTPSAGGFTLWMSVEGTGLTGRAFAEKLLREERVLVGPGDIYGPSGTNQIRVSYALDDGRLREALNRMGEFIQRQTGQPTILEQLALPAKRDVVTELAPAFSRG